MKLDKYYDTYILHVVLETSSLEFVKDETDSCGHQAGYTLMSVRRQGHEITAQGVRAPGAYTRSLVGRMVSHNHVVQHTLYETIGDKTESLLQTRQLGGYSGISIRHKV